uniref:Uncharacterized protein n=1 Tax=Anguilla anguilla TaxID=7936 RepID=A0A0E9QVQ2_ANGAN
MEGTLDRPHAPPPRFHPAKRNYNLCEQF